MRKGRKQNVLVIGSGGREHALAWKLRQSPAVGDIFIAPGNGGTEGVGKNININAGEGEKLKSFVLANNIDLTVVGPEEPLTKGIVDAFEKDGLKIFGPRKKAARLEGDKAWATRFMERHNIPHPAAKVFTDFKKALAFVKKPDWEKIVIKASGLAAGKGVLLPDTKEEAVSALHEVMVEKKFGEAGNKVVIQERIFGPEVSLLAFSDGKRVVPLPSAQDHKRIFDNDKGPNTGGMGAYAPVLFMTRELQEEVVNKILKPTVLGMKKEGTLYKGVLYAGLMLTRKGPLVLEFNCRFGDPEAQPLMLLLKSDLFKIFLSCSDGTLSQDLVSFWQGAAACIVLASQGYPGHYEKGKVIYGLDKNKKTNVQVFHAGTARVENQVVSSSGRVLGITGYGETIKSALKKAYSAVGRTKIHFDGMHYRKDIGKQAIQRKQYGLQD